MTAVVLLQYLKQGCTNTNRQLTKHAPKKPLHVTSLAEGRTQMARDHRLQPTFSHPAATSINHHNRIPSFHVNRFKKNKQTLAKSCPVHCQQDAHQPRHQAFSNWIRSNVGDTSPLDGPSVAPGKLPAAPLFVPPRWLELPSVFGQMHPKETSKACCRVPCWFQPGQKNKPILILPQKSFEVLSFSMLDPERCLSTKLICKQNKHKFTRPGPSTQLRGP